MNYRCSFEELARDWIWAEAVAGALGFVLDEVSGFWTQHRRQAVQLDVVGANKRERRLFIGEAKWGTGQVGRDILTNLAARSKRMRQVGEPDWKVQYGLFSRHGFTPAAIAAAKDIGARLVSLPQMESSLITAATRIATAGTGKVEF